MTISLSLLMSRPRHRGFTLVELLVVIVIIVLLIAIPMPALQRVRQTAGAVHCAVNLRQWTGAVNAFALDNQGELPRRGQGWQPTSMIVRTADWFNALPPYLSSASYYELVQQNRMPIPPGLSVWNCGQSTYNGSRYHFSYAMNMWLSTWFTAYPDNIYRVGPTSSMVFMADAPGEYSAVLPAAKPYSPVARHLGSLNIAFLDGHVARFSAEEAGVDRGIPERQDMRWRVPDSPWPGPPQ